MSPEWRPDWRVHPGESLREAIADLGISEAAFARQIGVTPPFVSNILRGRKGIGPKVALKLEAAGVGSAGFWLGMQMQFDLHRAREAASQRGATVGNRPDVATPRVAKATRGAKGATKP